MNLDPWKNSINISRQTGDIYSLSFPITPIEPPLKSDFVERIFAGPIVLITDALCYSAADIFAAGFQDHKVGKILGVNRNTGAGGANVWSQGLLRTLMDYERSEDEENPFKTLPKGCAMRVAVRRTLRQGTLQKGLPVEDLGIQPDKVHKMTRRDLVDNNADLLAEALKLIKVKREESEVLTATAG